MRQSAVFQPKFAGDGTDRRAALQFERDQQGRRGIKQQRLPRPVAGEDLPCSKVAAHLDQLRAFRCFAAQFDLPGLRSSGEDMIVRFAG